MTKAGQPAPSEPATAPRGRWSSACAPFLLVVAIALLLRVLYVVEIRDVGFFAQPLSDARVYADRAAGIAAGDLLGPAGFVHAPLYAYVWGGLQAVGLGGPWGVRLVQCGFGALACGLVLLTGRRLFGQWVGLVAGLLLAAFPPAIFFDGLLQKTSLALLLAAALLYLLVAWQRRDEADTETPPAAQGRRSSANVMALLVGLVFGLFVLTRQNALALGPVVAVVLMAGTGVRRWRRWGAAMLLCGAGFAVATGPWIVRNWVVLGDPMLSTPNLGQNFAMGNHPDATGTYLPFRRLRSTAEHEQAEWVRAAESAVGRSLSPREVSDYYFDAAWQYVRSHPLDWLRLTARKLLLCVGAYELPDTEDYYVYRGRAGVLAVLDRVWHFGALAPLAAAGMVLGRRRRGVWLLHAWWLITVLAVAAFVVFARYRMPVVPVFVLFAAVGLVEAVACWRAGHARRLIVPALVAGVTAVAVNWPIHHDRTPAATGHVNHAIALTAGGRYDEALAELDQALAQSPGHVDALLTRGSVLIDAERYDDALTAYRAAVAGDPDEPASRRGLGNALLRLGRAEEAATHFERALELDPADHRARTGLASALGAIGELAEARRLFEQVLADQPDDFDARAGLGNVQLAGGRADEAVASYEQALDLANAADSRSPALADLWHNLGIARLQLNDPEQALSCFRCALDLQPRHRDAQRAYVTLLLRLHRADDARTYLQDALHTAPDQPHLREWLNAIDEATSGDRD